MIGFGGRSDDLCTRMQFLDINHFLPVPPYQNLEISEPILCQLPVICELNEINIASAVEGYFHSLSLLIFVRLNIGKYRDVFN